SPTNFLAGPKGITIQDANGNVLMNNNPGAGVPSTGAAYVLISHGDNQAGAFPSGGGAVTATGVGAQLGTGGETQNANGQALQAFYVDNDLVEANDNTHFDDIVLRPSILSVINAANLGPRAH